VIAAGRKQAAIAAVLADESAFWPPEDSANPDVEIIRPVRPGLLTLPASLLVLVSTPYAKHGVRIPVAFRARQCECAGLASPDRDDAPWAFIWRRSKGIEPTIRRRHLLNTMHGLHRSRGLC
jgi:hypothetical protein